MEQEMLELAIRISLEEEEARQALEAEFAYVEDVEEPPKLPPRPSRSSSYPVVDGTDQLFSDSTDSFSLPPVPTRSLPAVPSSSSSSLRHNHSLSFVAPSRLKIFEYDDGRGSPIEMPFLTPSASFRTAREPSTSSSEEDDEEDEHPGRRLSLGTFGRSSNGGHSDEQGTEESSPSIRSTSSGTSSEEAAVFPPFVSTLAGRSLSFVSERTEPNQSNASLASLDDEPRTSTSSFPSTTWYDVGSESLNIGPSPALKARLASDRERERAVGITTSVSSTPSTRSVAPPGPTPSDFPYPSTSEEAAILQTSPPTFSAVDEPEGAGETFGDGVRFGYPASCAQEHACAMDGLHSTAPFLEEIELATAEGEDKGRFSVEARTWVALLRFLMW